MSIDMTEEKIKVLHIIPEDNTLFIGLCNHYLGYLSSSKYDSSVLYLIGYSNPETKKQTKAEEVMFWELNDSRLRLTFSNLIRFYQLIKKEKYDLVVCHSHTALMMACLINILKPVYKILGISYKSAEFTNPFINSMFYLCKKRLMLLAALKSIQADMHKNLKAMPKEKIQVSHFSLDFREIRHARLSRMEAKTKLIIKSGRFVFGVRHESGNKDDIFSILTAFSYARDEIQNGVLAIFCSKEEKKIIRDKVKELLIESVVSYKHDVDQFATYFRGFDGIIVTTDANKMSITLLQSMVSGLPVIANKTGSNEEYIGKDGYLYDASDAHQLTYYMDLLYKLTADERMLLKKKVLARINEKFIAQVCRKRFQASKRLQQFISTT